jgi:hypothetical protein
MLLRAGPGSGGDDIPSRSSASRCVQGLPLLLLFRPAGAFGKPFATVATRPIGVAG